MDELLYHTPIYRKEKGSANGLKPRCGWKIMPDFFTYWNATNGYTQLSKYPTFSQQCGLLCNKINYRNISLNSNKDVVKWIVLLHWQDDKIITTISLQGPESINKILIWTTISLWPSHQDDSLLRYPHITSICSSHCTEAPRA